VDGLAEALERVRERIDRACARAGRNPSEITLLAVTKVFPASTIHAAWEAGLREFGENYVQEFENKASEVRYLEGARFHLIGHLQSNKSRRAAELFDVIQTVDSAKLARRLNDAGRKLDVIVEVKLSGEESKTGASEAELPAILDAIRGAGNLNLKGLMTVPEWSEDAEVSRPAFAKLRAVAEQHGVSGLSMGMTNDFEVAIEEGATMIRIGTALFGRRKHA
jgi:hypothetical protein